MMQVFDPLQKSVNGNLFSDLQEALIERLDLSEKLTRMYSYHELIFTAGNSLMQNQIKLAERILSAEQKNRDLEAEIEILKRQLEFSK